MKIIELLQETVKSASGEAVLDALRAFFYKHVLTAEKKELDVDYHYMGLEQWREHYYRRTYRINHKDEVTKPLDISDIHPDAEPPGQPKEPPVFKIKIGKSNDFIHDLYHVLRPSDGWIHPADKRDLVDKWLTKWLKQYGWEITETNHGFVLEPMRGERVERPDFVYYADSVFEKDRILRKGIIPVRDRYHNEWPSRSGKKVDLLYTTEIRARQGGGYADREPVIVFKIDVSKCPKGITFYKDQHRRDKLWTYTHIPPRALTVVHEDPMPKEEDEAQRPF